MIPGPLVSTIILSVDVVLFDKKFGVLALEAVMTAQVDGGPSCLSDLVPTHGDLPNAGMSRGDRDAADPAASECIASHQGASGPISLLALEGASTNKAANRKASLRIMMPPRCSI